MISIIGRKEECISLRETLLSNKPQFVAVYGRRRIGKTYLIEKFYKKAKDDPILDKKIFYFNITATKKAKTPKLMKRFYDKINLDFNLKRKSKNPRSWDEVFNLLIEGVKEKQLESDKIVIFIDEFPWFQNSNTSHFLDSFNNAWANNFSQNEKIIIAVSGSAVSWLLKHVIYTDGELNSRITVNLELKPFTIKETDEFLKYNGCTFDKKQTIELYLAIGGIAEYLTKVQKQRSVHENINELYFQKNSFLKKEYSVICKAHFTDYKYHRSIIENLAKRPEGLMRDDLIGITTEHSGSAISTAIDDLEKTGFIAEKKTFGKNSSQKVYILADPYLMFYHKWVVPFIKTKTNDKDYWIKTKQSEGFVQWAGRAFENVCFSHKELIKSALGISGLKTTESCWKYTPEKKNKEQGSQIDYIIERPDAIQIIECKFYSHVWSVNKDDRENFIRKKKNFIVQNNINTDKQTILTCLISVFGASEGDNFNECFGQQLLAEDIFF